MKKKSHDIPRRPGRSAEANNAIRIDPEFERLIPPLTPAELADLHASLDAEGCRDALLVWKGKALLVDGHNRYHHCHEHGYSFRVEEKEFASREAVKEYIIALQLGRRNLSPVAESYLRGKRYLAMRRPRARTDLQGGQTDRQCASERMGQEYGVGEKTIRREGRFAEAIDRIVENCGPEARNLMLQRGTGLARGAIVRLAKLSAEQQVRFLDELKTSGKAPRKPWEPRVYEKILLPSQPEALARAVLRQMGKKTAAAVMIALAQAVNGPAKE